MILQNIASPKDLKKLSQKQLPLLVQELRNAIISVVGKNGGHLASNLGVVELSVALHRVFDSPQDAIIWDVSHQCYSHKILTGRYSQFGTLRKHNGISGFTKICESEHDFFDAGHASSSISSALGLLASWQIEGRTDKVIAVIGDGALTGGMAFEALNHAGQIAKNLIVIVNDNQMSISPNVGSFSTYLSSLTMTGFYQSFKNSVDFIVDKIPFLNKFLGKFIYRFKRGLKGLFLNNNFFSDLGFEYVGPLDGHNIKQLEKVFKHVKNIDHPAVVHVVTKKGKGYSPAENDPSTFHGVGPFNITDGVMEKFDSESFTKVFSDTVVEEALKNEKICAVTAAMGKGTGLDSFARKFPERFFDVGIAEEHAVTFAGGLACGAMIPVVAIYSTFMQRSVDQIIEDIALQNRHVVMMLDRAGAVPQDGETHQGIFDIALFKPIPNIILLSPATKNDLQLCFKFAVNKTNFPVAIRYPKLACPSDFENFAKPVEIGRGIFLSAQDISPSLSVSIEDNSKTKKILLVCTGSIFSETLIAARSLLMNEICAEIFSLRFIKPFDEEFFYSIAKNYDAVIFAEDGISLGGISNDIDLLLKKNPITKNIRSKVLAFPDNFVPNGNREQILSSANLSSSCIVDESLEILK